MFSYKSSIQRPNVADYFQLTKPKIVFLLAITGMVAYILPTIGSIKALDVIVYLILGYGAAGGAMTINNAIDYDIDSKMDRTKHRASIGKMSRLHVTIFGSTLMFSGIIIAAIYFGIYTAIYLSWGSFFYIFGYSILLKRNTWLNTIIGGLASPAPIWGGYAARYEIIKLNSPNLIFGVPLEGWLLGLLVFLWTPTHTWAMAVKNYDDYRKADIPMLPVILGIANTASVTLIVGSGVIVYATLLVMKIQISLLVPTILIDLAFFYYLLKFSLNPTIEDGTKCFHAHNIWLGLLFLLLLL